MHVEERVQVLLAEGVELSRLGRRHVRVAELATHDIAILGFDQFIVGAASGALAGEIDALLLKHIGHVIVDVFGSAIATKAEDAERELIEHGAQYWQHMFLRQSLHGGDDLPQGNAVDGVDVIDAIHAIHAAEVALMATVDADKAGPVIG